MFTVAVQEAAKEHAKAEFPKESVGFIAKNEYIPLVNISTEPTKGFEVDKSVWLHYPNVQGIVHSHPMGEAIPSEMDMRQQMATNVPWGIIVCDSERATDPMWFGDHTLNIPLSGQHRYFRHGVTDCYALIRAYYKQKRATTLLDFPRSWEWWVNKKNLYEEGFEKAGFVEIPASHRQPGDVFLAKIRSEVANHGGIYLGGTGEMILHHLTAQHAVDFSRVAVEEPGIRYLNFVSHWLRYKG